MATHVITGPHPQSLTAERVAGGGGGWVKVILGHS